jgi:hypothetical protein
MWQRYICLVKIGKAVIRRLGGDGMGDSTYVMWILC